MEYTEAFLNEYIRRNMNKYGQPTEDLVCAWVKILKLWLGKHIITSIRIHLV